ncbi:MAG: alpha-hydroxy-acid oxidizing protein, partial [Pseudorhodoplanes sp.]
MSEQAWAYVSGGAADEITLRENCAAFQRLSLRARV